MRLSIRDGNSYTNIISKVRGIQPLRRLDLVRGRTRYMNKGREIGTDAAEASRIADSQRQHHALNPEQQVVASVEFDSRSVSRYRFETQDKK